MGLFSKKAVEHVWEKKDVSVPQLKEALEGNSSPYTNDALQKIAKKYLKYDKRGVSNLYLIKESDDEGVVSAVYVFSIMEDSIDEDMIMMIRDAAMKNLSIGEMRAEAFDQKPDEWWETNTEACMKRVEKGKPDGFTDYLVAELAPKGMIVTERQGSAVAWGIAESGLRKGIKSRLIQNEYL